MIYIRNIIFWILLIITTCLFFIGFILSIPFPIMKRNYVGRAYASAVLWLLRIIIGLKFRVEGLENIPKEPAIICCKHQSAYETLALQKFFPPQVFIAKKELIYFPLVGIGLMVVSSILIDRKAKTKAIDQIIEQGRERKKAGLWISIFPEGTRVSVSAKSNNYKIGAALLARATCMNIIPVSTNSGVFWPKNSFLKYPGEITFVISEPINYDFGEAEEIIKELARRIEEKQAIIDKVSR